MKINYEHQPSFKDTTANGHIPLCKIDTERGT